MKKILFWAVIMLFAACGRIIKVSDLQYKEGERKSQGSVLPIILINRTDPLNPLDKIEQIGGMLDKIEILDITFDEVNANVAFKVG